MKRFDAISLFSGAMGLDLGFERVGQLIGSDFGPVRARFAIKACIESNEACIETITTNAARGRTRSKTIRIYEDIREITRPRSILKECAIRGELPLIIGGPPCQTFSTAGRRGTVQDPRGILLWEFVRFVKAIRPRFFLMENVRGLLSAAIRHRPISKRGGRHPNLTRDERPGSVYQRLISDCEKIGYHVDTFEVNAVNYGTPQLRERALLIGNKFNVEVRFPRPILGRKISASGNSSSVGRFRTLRDVIQGLDGEPPLTMDFSPRKKRYLSMIPPGGNWRFLPNVLRRKSMGRARFAGGGRSGWYRRLDWDSPSPCLLVAPNHAGTSLCHPQEIRALSIQEYKRIQEFPDDWELCGALSQKYSQLGNAVPLRLGEIAGKVIGDCLVSLKEYKEVMPGQKVKPSKRTYLESHVRSRKWFEGGQPIAWRYTSVAKTTRESQLSRTH